MKMPPMFKDRPIRLRAIGTNAYGLLCVEEIDTVVLSLWSRVRRLFRRSRFRRVTSTTGRRP